MSELHYLSFADPKQAVGTQWLGAIIIAADSFLDAVMKTHELLINPGGEIMGKEITGDPVPLRFRDRLLSRDDLVELGKEIADNPAIVNMATGEPA